MLTRMMNLLRGRQGQENLSGRRQFISQIRRTKERCIGLNPNLWIFVLAQNTECWLIHCRGNLVATRIVVARQLFERLNLQSTVIIIRSYLRLLFGKERLLIQKYFPPMLLGTVIVKNPSE